MIGKTLGQYQITHKLGAGGMGVVYRARDTKLERAVALKVLPADLLADPAAQNRLLDEARMASALNHPNICTIYEVGREGDVTFATMEYVEGRSLRALIPAGGLPIELVIRYGAQVADAVSYAHDHGVVHRDIKTTNVMVTPEGRVKVLDFGLARRVASDAELATRGEASVAQERVAGTLHYLAPEVLRGEAADARSDIWAVGVVLYEMAAGRLPYDAASSYELTSAILRDPLPALPARVPAGLRAIIQRCLAREAGQRYQRAGEVRAALETISSSDLAIPAAAQGSAPQAAGGRRGWIAAAATVIVLAAVGWFAWPRWNGQPPRPVNPASAGPRLSTGGKLSANAEANEYFEKSAVILLASQRDLARARQMMERALELDPKFAEARAWRAFMIYLELDAAQTNDSRLLYEVEAETRQALKDDPDCIKAHSVLATIYMMQGRKELARAEAEKALALKPNDPDATVWLGHYHWEAGDSQIAMDMITRSLQSNPLFWPLRMNRGEYLRKLGQYAEAQREQEKVLEQDPLSFYALRNLARIHMDTGNLAEARRALERARPQDRKNFGIRVSWALLLALEGKRAEALREMTPEILQAMETGVLGAENGAEFYAVLGDSEKALHWLDRSFRLGEENLDSLQRDPLLANIRKHPRFKQVLDSIEFRHQQRRKQSR